MQYWLWKTTVQPEEERVQGTVTIEKATNWKKVLGSLHSTGKKSTDSGANLSHILGKSQTATIHTHTHTHTHAHTHTHTYTHTHTHMHAHTHTHRHTHTHPHTHTHTHIHTRTNTHTHAPPPTTHTHNQWFDLFPIEINIWKIRCELSLTAWERRENCTLRAI